MRPVLCAIVALVFAASVNAQPVGWSEAQIKWLDARIDAKVNAAVEKALAERGLAAKPTALPAPTPLPQAVQTVTGHYETVCSPNGVCTRTFVPDAVATTSQATVTTVEYADAGDVYMADQSEDVGLFGRTRKHRIRNLLQKIFHRKPRPAGGYADSSGG